MLLTEILGDVLGASFDVRVFGRGTLDAALDVEAWDVSYLAVVVWRISHKPFDLVDRVIEPVMVEFRSFDGLGFLAHSLRLIPRSLLMPFGIGNEPEM